MNSDRKPIQSPISGYLKTLDGWRAVAILSVIAYHDRLESVGKINDKWIHDQGALGVDLFFAISGLLICSRLLAEERKTSRISITNFYIRRSFRIFPPMIVYLAAIAALGYANIIHVGRTAWFASLLFFNNYYSALRHDVDWSLYTNHFWSLAVEEHFYLLLPSLLVFFPRHRAKLLGTLSIVFLLYTLGYSFLNAHKPYVDFTFCRTGLRIDQLLFPAFLAVLLGRDDFRGRFIRLFRPAFVLPLVLILLVVGPHVSHVLTFRILVPFVFPFLILATMLHPGSVAGRVLEWQPLRAIGRISYSIYLWQQLFFIGNHSPAAGVLGFLQQSGWKLVATLAAATASYFIVEKPLIRLGYRVAPPATPGHSNLATAPASGT
jgi:peptidoglycan/LPS O-acetylase OafA/YrhL